MEMKIFLIASSIMRIYGITLLLVGITTASNYMGDGCLVPDNYEIDTSLNFTVLPPSENFKVFLSRTNATLLNKSWTVQLAFYTKRELRLSNGIVLLDQHMSAAHLYYASSPLQPLSQEIEITDTKILPNCSQGEPLWNMTSCKMEIYIENQLILNCTQTDVTNDSRCPMHKEEFQMSIIRDGKTFKVKIGDCLSKDIEVQTENRLRIKKSQLYLVQLKQGHEHEEGSGQWTNVLTMGVGVIGVLLIISILLNIMLCYYLPNDIKRRLIPGNSKYSAENQNRESLVKNSSTGEQKVFNPRPPMIPSRKNSHKTDTAPFVTPRSNLNQQTTLTTDDRESYYLPMGPNFSYTKTPNGTPNQYDEDDDYICPEAVRPSEVEILRKENVIQGLVTPEEVKDRGRKINTPKGDYLNLGDLKGQSSSPATEEPDYMNFSKNAS